MCGTPRLTAATTRLGLVIIDWLGACFSFAFLPVENWFHPSAAPLRRAGLCATRFSRLSFAFSPRSEHVPPSLARLDLVRNLPLMPSPPRWLITHLSALYKHVAMPSKRHVCASNYKR